MAVKIEKGTNQNGEQVCVIKEEEEKQKKKKYKVFIKKIGKSSPLQDVYLY
jgi:uncharacterized lipoprotein